MTADRQKTSAKIGNAAAGVTPILLITDYAAIVCAEQAAYCLRNVFFTSKLHISWMHFWVVFPLLYLIFLFIKRLYTRRAQFWQILQSVFSACVYGTIAVIIELYAVRASASYSRFFVFALGILAFIFLAFFRYGVKKFLDKRGIMQESVLIIGAGKTAELLVQGIEHDVGMGYKVIGFLEDRPADNMQLLWKFPVLGGFKDAERVIKKTGVQSVVIAAPGMEQEELKQLIYRVQPLVKNLSVVPNLIGMPMGEIEAETLFKEKLLILRVKNRLAEKKNKIFKAIFDYTLTICGTILVLPFLAVIGILIKYDSPGSIIYNGERIGMDGKIFKCYKFRSMYTNGDEILEKYLAEDPEKREEWEVYHKLDSDPRVTRVGRFIRKTSIDELPQIFNVLKGEMSLVGARPYLPREKEDMKEAYRVITMAKPGITGFWQVSGRSDVSFKERLEMDSWYIRNWNLWLDIMLLWKTVGVVLMKKGAK